MSEINFRPALSDQPLIDQFKTIDTMNMTPPTTLVNTYIRVDGKPHIDSVSKMFIICGMIVGVNRTPLLGHVNPLITLLLICYSLTIAINLLIFFRTINNKYFMEFAIASFLFQCFFLMVFNLVSIRRLQRYYNEVNTFDIEVSCTPKIGKGTIRNIVQTIFIALYMIIIFIMTNTLIFFTKLSLCFLPIIGCHIIELSYIGHLLSLLIPRLRMINYYMAISLTNTKLTKAISAEEFGFSSNTANKTLCKMEKLMNLYHIIVKAYNYLIEAIKWQLLVTLVSSFLSILCYSYDISYAIIKDETTIPHVVTCLGISLGIMLPLFAPCSLGDQVHNEVRRLRELLASRLYENQLDKASRGIARALLAWTETRDLSFTLLRMLNIDISLPFKFVGLLVTYLIILLQFQKVINP